MTGFPAGGKGKSGVRSLLARFRSQRVSVQPYNYWSGTVYAPAPGSNAWNFNFGNGNQNNNNQNNAFHAWAVRPGG